MTYFIARPLYIAAALASELPHRLRLAQTAAPQPAPQAAPQTSGAEARRQL